MPLRDALGDPHDVPHFLLPQLRVRIEHATVELPGERQHVHLHLARAQSTLCQLARSMRIYQLRSDGLAVLEQ